MPQNKFPFIKQLDSFDCGPACLRMIVKYYGKEISNDFLRENGRFIKSGISFSGLGELSEKLNLRSLCAKIDVEKLVTAPLPLIAHWNQNHFIVVYRITKNKIFVADPGLGLLMFTKSEFLKGWAQGLKNNKEEGIVLLLEPTPDFSNSNLFSKEIHNKASFSFLLKYLIYYKRYVIQLVFGLLLGSVLQIVFPFLTQLIVDYGIGNHSTKVIYVILSVQLFLYISSTAVEFIRSWVLIHLSSRINIFIISDFLIKLMKLPIKFFDIKIIGDLMQRIQDHKRIEQFMTDTLLKSLFSIFSIIILGIILAYYNLFVFLIFLVFTTFELSWIFFFLGKQRALDNKSFAILSEDQNKIYELLTGMQEIKLNNIEKKKRWEWERIQAALFKVNISQLKLNQIETGGSRFFSYLQLLLMLLITSTAVIEGKMTLGVMMAIVFIYGQLNVPINQLINFIIGAQMAKISLERLSEIHTKKDENAAYSTEGIEMLFELHNFNGIFLKDVSFSYINRNNSLQLSELTLTIPKGQVTAIVGSSGSGKTTLLKLLLKFYSPLSGTINLENTNLSEIDNTIWRKNIGTVMQDSFIFSDSIANNIALSDDQVNHEKLLNAVSIANIKEFIESLPLNYNTKIGQDGSALSQGQKQRILIARAVYKNPEFLFFDEATNALDATNESTIMRNLQVFFKNKTVLIVAHRLSTVKNAAQIIVLDEGKVVEIGKHEELINNKKKYYELVKDQLELNLV